MNFKSILGRDMSAIGYGYSGFVIAECDDFKEKETTKIGGVEIDLNPAINNNHRISHPQIGTVVSSSGNCNYKKGDKIFCAHFTFTNEDKTPKRDVVIGDKSYSKIINHDIIAKIDNGKLVPREGILLCSPVSYSEKGEVVKIKTKRRDILRVDEVFNDCEEVGQGDLILIEKDADYYIEYEGKEYIAVDLHFDDVIAIVDDVDWEINEFREHKTNYTIEEYE